MLQSLRSWLARVGARRRGKARADLPRPQDARTPIESATSPRPEDADLNYRTGLVHLADGDAAEALDGFHLALHYAPDMYPACAARVRALLALGRSSEEPGAYQEFLRANPGHADAAYALAVWHHARGEHEPARELLRPLVDRQPRHRNACNLLGLILGREFGQFEEGERLLRLALEPDPLWSLALSNLGWILLEKGDYVQGMELLDTALARDPQDHDTRLVRSYMNLKRGAFEQGWSDYEARHHSRFAAQRPLQLPQWDGTPVAAKTLRICAEQGFGDQIMFASCFHEAIERAGRCIIECDPRLTALFRRSFPSALIEASAPPAERAAGVAPTQAADCWIPMGSLPGLFRKRREAFPRHAGYVLAAPERVAYWRARLEDLGPGVKIGLSWRGGVAVTRRHLRSLGLQEFLPLLRLPAKCVSLQYGDCADELHALSREQGVVLPHWRDALNDYDETAALVCALDLVISVCTAVIHLAGALGKPVWVLVPAVAEWRYLDRGESMPWYPSARLFRQTASAGWQQVVAQVADEAEHLARSIDPRRS